MKSIRTMQSLRAVWRGSLLFFGIFVLSGCGLSLAGDVTPPPNYRPPAQMNNPAKDAGQAPMASGPTQSADAVTFPLVPPDPAQGAPIFTEKCAPCHGDTGMGDGVRAAQLPNPAAPIGSADLANQARPVDWYQMVTVGNLEKFMPGFSQGLTDRQRWDVVAYVYTLSVGKDQIAQGKAVYTQQCAACHGTIGAGDGPQAASLSGKPAAFTDQARLAQLSNDDMTALIASGKGEMPALGDKISPADQAAAAVYVRSLSFAGTQANPSALDQTPVPTTDVNPAIVEAADTLSPQTTGTPAADANPSATLPAGTETDQKVTITGQVSNGTPGGTLPAGLKVELNAFQGMNPAFNQSVEAAADGSYTFQNVAFKSDYVYMVRVDANGITFNSDILHGTDIAAGQAALPIKVYDATTDASGLIMDRMHVFFDFTTPGLVQVVNLYIVSNLSDQVVVSAGQNKPVVQVELPQGAQNLQFQDGAIGGRYVQTANGFGDLSEVTPGQGQHQILFAYDLPYKDGLNVTLKAPVPVDAAIVMAPPGVTVKSSQLQDAGQRDVQGMSFRMYQSPTSLKAGETLTLALSGSASDAASGQTTNTTTYLLIGLGAFGAVLIGAGLWLYTRRRNMALATVTAPLADGAAYGQAQGAPGLAMEVERQSSEALLDAIMTLDDLHASGKLAEQAYQERRAELKNQLAEALLREKIQGAGRESGNGLA